MKFFKAYFIVFAFLCAFINISAQEDRKLNETKSSLQTNQEGMVILQKVYSSALEGNFMGDDPNRNVKIYLPPGYTENTDLYYPTITLLAYHGGNHNSFFNYGGENISKVMDELINNGTIKPMILVCPDCKNKFNDCHFANSSLSGNWEDFLTKDLVAYMDNNFRSITNPKSRGIGGFSSGAYGALKIATKNPGVYGAVYALSSPIDFKAQINNQWKDNIVRAIKADAFPTGDMYVNINFGMAVAFSPNKLNPPSYGNFPVTEDGALIDSTWQKWLRHDPVMLVNPFKDSLQKLTAIKFDCGTEDDLHITSQNYSDTLSEYGIQHVFESYTGGHGDKLFERIRSDVLPFFSDTLQQRFLEMENQDCLGIGDSLFTKSGMYGNVYVVPVGTAKSLAAILEAQLRKTEVSATKLTKIDLTGLDYGLYQAYNVSNEGYISQPVKFSYISDTPIATLKVVDFIKGTLLPDFTVKVDGSAVQADENGKVSVEGCGLHTLNINADNYTALDTSLMIYLDTTFVVKLVKDSYFRLTDKTSGEPIPGIMVRYGDKSSTTNSNGIIAVPNLKTGTFAFTSLSSKYFTLADTVLCNPGDTATIQLTRKKADVTIIVQDGNGPVVGLITNFDGAEYITDADGKISIADLAARNEYKFNIENGCYNTFQDSVYIEINDTLNVVLEPKTISPTITVVQLGGDSISISASMDGNVYLVPDGTALTPESILANSIDNTSVSENVQATMQLKGETGENVWVVFLASSCQNIVKWDKVIVEVAEISESDFKIYPNPAYNEVMITHQLLRPVTIELLSSNGVLLKKFEISGTKQQINLSDYSSGVYFIHLKSDDFIYTEKIIKL